MEETSSPMSDVASTEEGEKPTSGARRPRAAGTSNRTPRTAPKKSLTSKAAETADAEGAPVSAEVEASSIEAPRPASRKASGRKPSQRKSPSPEKILPPAAQDGPSPLGQSVAIPQVTADTPVPTLMESRELVAVESVEHAKTGDQDSDPASSKRRRRRGGRGRKRTSVESVQETAAPSGDKLEEQNGDSGNAPSDAPPSAPIAEEMIPPRSRRNRPSRTRGKKQSATLVLEASSEEDTSEESNMAVDSIQPFEYGSNVQEHETIALSADTPALLIRAAGSVLEAIAVVNELEANRGNRARHRGGRGRGSSVTQVPAEAQDAYAKPQPRQDGKGLKLLVTVLPEEQVEVVVLESGKVREYYIEMMHQAKIRGNIYKGVISNIDTNLQAAFVNYGASKNGFLQIDEIHPEYYLTSVAPAKGHKYPPIQKVMKAGQEVLVQVGKEPTGNKGAFLTTWISLAGRFLVLTPGQEQIGISRKVEDGEERNRLRELIKGLNPGEGVGAIVRTVSAGVTKTTMQKDLSYLKRLWRDIRKKGQQEKAPSLIHAEPNLAARSIRDYLTDDVTEVWVDDEATAASMRDMVTLLFPRKTDIIKLHTDSRRTLLERFDVMEQIEQIHAREVVLPSGGRLVFDQTEALMAIDINSGKSGGSNNKANFETMAYRTNMEAAEMIPQQLRLRDIGGQVVIDFIEMRDQNQVREVEKTLRTAMKSDRARHDVGRMSSFGLLQIVRQRTGSSAISISMEACPFCQGTGTRRNMEWQAIQALRDIHRKIRDAHDSGQTGLIYTVETELAWCLLNHKRATLTALEQDSGVSLEIRPARKE